MSSFQPLRWVATTRKTTVDSNDSVEYVRPEGKNTIYYKLRKRQRVKGM